MASSGPQADYHKPKRPTGSGMAGVCVDGGVAHRWRRSAYVTCLVFMPCSKFFAKASADNCSIQERGSFLFFFLLLSFFCLLLGCSFGAVSSSGPGAASCGSCSPTVCPTVRLPDCPPGSPTGFVCSRYLKAGSIFRAAHTLCPLSSCNFV